MTITMKVLTFSTGLNPLPLGVPHALVVKLCEPTYSHAYGRRSASGSTVSMSLLAASESDELSVASGGGCLGSSAGAASGSRKEGKQ
jgi:hypothetical protein